MLSASECTTVLQFPCPVAYHRVISYHIYSPSVDLYRYGISHTLFNTAEY